MAVSELTMRTQLICFLSGALLMLPVQAADLIVSANDGKYVRVEGVSTYPQPAPSDSLAVIDASQFPPVLKVVVEGVVHTIAGPPQAVAITPDGKLAIIGAPSKHDYAAQKESFGTFLQVVDLEASPPKLIDRVEIGVPIRMGCRSIRTARYCSRPPSMALLKCCPFRAKT
jgi:hypothetical protein